MDLKICCLLLVAIVLCTNFSSTESMKVIFYNDQETIKQSNLFVTNQRTKPCGYGMKRDHNDRCRRIVTFTRKRRS